MAIRNGGFGLGDAFGGDRSLLPDPSNWPDRRSGPPDSTDGEADSSHSGDG
jgi:hypothetical protein